MEPFLKEDARARVDLPALIASLEEELSSLNFQKLHVFGCDKYLSSHLPELGYKIILESIGSTFDLTTLKGKSFSEAKAGVEILSFSDLEKELRDKVWDFILPIVCEIMSDIPGASEIASSITAQKLRDSWTGDHFLSDGCFFLRKDGELIGLQNNVTENGKDLFAFDLEKSLS